MILSVRYTVEEYLAGLKTQTSRPNWTPNTMRKWQKAWDEGRYVHQAWSASPFVKGARRLPDFRLTRRPYWGSVAEMTEDDLKAEGGRWLTREEFAEALGTALSWKMPVLRFEMVEENDGVATAGMRRSEPPR